MNTLLLERSGPVLRITLNRPEVKNAMSAQMVQELVAAFTEARDDDAIRAVLLRGAGGAFCAGGDIKDMAGSSAPEAVQARNRAFGAMLELADQCPKPVVALVEGPAMGGGFGLACIADVTIAEAGAGFAMPEVSLGILPAQIAPFVVARIGFTQARRLGVTGGRIDGREAVRIGLAHEVAEGKQDLEAKGLTALNAILRCAPGAVATTKALMRRSQGGDLGATLDAAAASFVAALGSAEGREGTKAFVEKRKPAWAAEV
ncbi:enoyl-CoA hydratase/isomerase family protein [Ferrovibrio sp.]|uniref:enoyl-CoA hydratase/isomerase family protein n=1 Tax=Ferrovibrio sp. TaxID=1917215 RepID=UPI003D2CD8C0